jgi:hypothetical protein
MIQSADEQWFMDEVGEPEEDDLPGPWGYYLCTGAGVMCLIACVFLIVEVAQR